MKQPVITVIGLCGQSVFMQVDHFHEEGETLHSDSLYSEPGGKGYNQCVAARRLGAEVNFIGCIGNDSDGKMCSDYLVREGITPLMQLSNNHATAFAVILTDSSGRNRVTVHRGAADDLSSDFIKEVENQIISSDILLLNNECSDIVNNTAIDIAYRNNVKVILNPAPARKISQEFADKCFLIVPNESENRIIDCCCKNKIVTLGEKGADIYSDGITSHIDAVNTTCVDSTGAGDCFCGALAVSIAEGNSIPDAARFAVKCSGYSVSKQFVMPSLPRRDQI